MDRSVRNASRGADSSSNVDIDHAINLNAGGRQNGNGDAAQRALLNSVVLQNIFKLCPSDVLATCRLVCKTWCDVSLPVWRATSTIIYERSMVDRRIRVGRSFLTEVLDSWEMEQNGERPSASPHQRHVLMDWEIKFGALSMTRSVAECARFMELAGKNIIYLELLMCEFGNYRDFERVVFEYCPNLTHLTINGPQFGAVAATNHQQRQHPRLTTLNLTNLNELPVTMHDFLSGFPSLNSILITKIRPGPLEIVNAIQRIKNTVPESLQLKRFDFQHPPLMLSNEMDEEDNDEPPELMTLINELSLPLQSIAINMISCNLEMLQQLVVIHGNHLKRIEGVMPHDRENYDVATFPCHFPFSLEMNNLNQMVVCKGFCRSLDFLQFTPNLERLVISETNDDDEVRLFPFSTNLISNTSITRLANVKMDKLKEFYMGYSVSLDCVGKLTRLFTNLNMLTMFLNDEQFSLVCEQWKALQYVHVLGDELTDRGITGLDRERNRPRSREQKPNITHLDRLLCFKMTKYESSFTDQSAYCGFLLLPQLRVLDITSYTHRFGKAARRALTDKIEFCFVSHRQSFYSFKNNPWELLGRTNPTRY